jgi:hypothetical protein
MPMSELRQEAVLLGVVLEKDYFGVTSVRLHAKPNVLFHNINVIFID